MKGIFALVIDLHERLQLPSLKDLPGRRWTYELSKEWTICINGNGKPVEMKPEGSMGCNVPPYSMVAFFNGWLAGIFTPNGREEMVAGSLANEDSLRHAIEHTIEAIKEE